MRTRIPKARHRNNSLLKLYQAFAWVLRESGKMMLTKWPRVAVAFTAAAFTGY
jgi:hypothetical protein